MTRMSAIGIEWPMNTGHFEIIASLGSGATAEVFKARNSENDKLVALKSFLSFVSQDAEALSRLRAEVQILKSLDHPNVVKMYGEHILDGQLCLELELVEGTDLRGWMKSKKNSLVELDLWILVQMARGLGAVHEQGIIHRDLKPENILISFDGNVKLSDFGLAKELNRLTMTRLGLLVGSLGYMAPEVTNGGKATTASDLFSFGAIAYELLSGEAPFKGDTAQSLLKCMMEPVIPLNQVAPHIPPRIGKLVDSCLSSEEADRPESIWAVESEILGFLGSTGVLPYCRKLLNRSSEPSILKEALVAKKNFLDEQSNLHLDHSLKDNKQLLYLINEYQQSFPETEKIPELLALLQKKKFIWWRHPIVAAPLVLVFLSLGLYSMVDWPFFRSNAAKERTNMVKEVAKEKVNLVKTVDNASVLVLDKKAKQNTASTKVEEKPKKEPMIVNPAPTKTTVAKKLEPKPKKAKKVVKKAKPATGSLAFEVDDDVTIFVDGKSLTKEQLKKFTLKAGNHKVKMVKEGFLPIENEIFVKRDKVTTIRAKGSL